jgi:hypothetical protein
MRSLRVLSCGAANAGRTRSRGPALGQLQERRPDPAGVLELTLARHGAAWTHSAIAVSPLQCVLESATEQSDGLEQWKWRSDCWALMQISGCLSNADPAACSEKGPRLLRATMGMTPPPVPSTSPTPQPCRCLALNNLHPAVAVSKTTNRSLITGIGACSERAHLMNAAPYMAHPLPTIIPIYRWWEVPYMWVGAKMYDFVAGACIPWLRHTPA